MSSILKEMYEKGEPPTKLGARSEEKNHWKNPQIGTVERRELPDH